MNLEQWIKGDWVLNRFIYGDIDYFNPHQVNLRYGALRVAISQYIDFISKTF